MASRESGRTPRQVFGAMVHYYRDRAGLSRPELARQISKSVSLIQAIELGHRAATADVTSDLERALSAEGALTRLREEMGDGLGYQAYPSWFQEWLLIEGEATRLRGFEPMLVPGLLETAEYARAVFGARLGATDEEIDEQVAARLNRQEILERSEPTQLWVIIDESVLRRAVGGPCVMREQIQHLIAAAQRPHISMQVIPAATTHRGLWAGGFAIADCDNAPTVGYQETASQGQFVDRREDVEMLVDCWDTLVREALPWAASQALLEEAAKSWTSASDMAQVALHKWQRRQLRRGRDLAQGQLQRWQRRRVCRGGCAQRGRGRAGLQGSGRPGAGVRGRAVADVHRARQGRGSLPGLNGTAGVRATPKRAGPS